MLTTTSVLPQRTDNNADYFALLNTDANHNADAGSSGELLAATQQSNAGSSHSNYTYSNTAAKWQ